MRKRVFLLIVCFHKMDYFAKEAMGGRNDPRYGKGNGSGTVSPQSKSPVSGRAMAAHPAGTSRFFVALHLAKTRPRKQFFGFRRAAASSRPGRRSVPEIYALSMTDAQTSAKFRTTRIPLDEFHRCGARKWRRSTTARHRNPYIQQSCRILPGVQQPFG